jgi:hypothetical protein
LVYIFDERRTSTTANADNAAAGIDTMKQTGSFLSRRKLLAGLGGVAVGAAAVMAASLRTIITIASRDLVQSQPAPRRLILFSLAAAGYNEWLDQVGSVFTVGGGTSMKLVAVTAFNTVGARPAGLGRDRAFIAKFDVQNGGTMAGDLIYTTMTPRFGAFPIFLTGSNDPTLRHRMTAVFN